MTNLSSVFFGVPQSRYAALAILLAIVVVALVILFGDSPVPLSQKFGFVLMLFLISLPGLALSLFQLTCIVTGAGFDNKRWWCSVYAWVLSAIMIFYAVLLVVAAVMSLKSKTSESFSDKKNPVALAHFTDKVPVVAKFANGVLKKADDETAAPSVTAPSDVPAVAAPAMPTDVPAVAAPAMPSATPSAEPVMPSVGGAAAAHFSVPSPAPVAAAGKMEQFTSSYAAW